MSDDLVYIPSPTEDGYVSLSKTPTGRLLRKQILPMNSYFVHPKAKDQKIFVDKKMAQSLVDNFNTGNYIVQVPIVNDKNEHVEDPLRNAGEVIDVDYDETGVYATIDARKYADDFGTTILGASALLHLDYSTDKGEHVGPTLLHVAATNRPYVNGLDGFTDIIKASADNLNETPTLFVREEVSLTNTNEDGQMTYDEMIAAFKEEHNVDVPSLLEAAEKATELSAQLEEVNNQLSLSASDSIDVRDLAEAVVELSNAHKEDRAEIETLKAKNEEYAINTASAEVDGLILKGRLLPKQREAMVKLSMTDRDTFDSLVPDTAVVSLSESGVTVHDEPAKAAQETLDRYMGMAAKIGKPKTR